MPDSPWRFIVLLGIVSLCADATYEGARSISGAFWDPWGPVARWWAWWPAGGAAGLWAAPGRGLLERPAQ